MTPTEVLEAAKQKIAQGWCQGNFGQTEMGHPVAIDDACRVCADGALYAALGPAVAINPKIGGPVYFAAKDYLLSAIGPVVSIWAWNDAKGRTQAEVLAAFDKAIELSKAREQ